jgi:two-component system phosphate regulon sensor histidine kinase PhoR
MKNSIIIRVVALGSLAVIGILAIQFYLLVNTWDVEEKEFQEKVTIALQSVVKEFEKLGSQVPAFDLINQVSSNYYVVNINDFIDANNLEFFLRRELEEVGLREDFEYGIYNCDSRKMAYGKYISYSSDIRRIPSTKNEQLPVHDDYLYYFGVRFPNRTTQILSDMRLTLIFAAILLVTILFFLYSIFIILRQKRLSEMQKDFINNMTHEFKTPISTIKISADVFANSPVIAGNQRLLQYANIIREQNQRLNNQVEKVLQLAKIERDNFKLNLEIVDINVLLTNILESTKLQIEKQGGSLVCELNASNAQVNADKLHLTNIIHNLLDNGIKYCKDVPHISVKTEYFRADKIKLTITDQGVGIPKEHLNRIFDKFFRVPTGNVHNVKGFGLGLFYTKNVCDAHGWKINIDSEPGKNTTVTLLMTRLS